MIKVKAKSLPYAVTQYAGYYDNRRIREGEEFFINSREELGKWMDVIEEEVEVEDELEVPKKIQPKRSSKKSSKPKSLDVI